MRLSLAEIALIVTQPAWADVLVENVDGLTLGADGTVQRFSGLLIDNNGRIQQIFLRKHKRRARTDYRIDAKVRVLMPALIAGGGFVLCPLAPAAIVYAVVLGLSSSAAVMMTPDPIAGVLSMLMAWFTAVVVFCVLLGARR